MPWFAECGEICRREAALAPHTWYGLGGPARWLVTPRSVSELAEVVGACRGEGLAWKVLGKGANVLVRDAGFDGAVIRLAGPEWEQVNFTENGFEARGGIDFVQMVKRSVGLGRGGLEVLAGVPGTLGGIVRMNAGGKYGSIADVIESVRVLTPEGVVENRAAADVGFAYRKTNLAGCIVLGASGRLTTSSAAEVDRRYREIWTEKYRTQPTLAQRSSGCVFKNPGPAPAGRLIDEAGLKGERRGGAQISTRHANFIVATEGATAQDVLDLIALAQERVRESAGVELQLEVEVW